MNEGQSLKASSSTIGLNSQSNNSINNQKNYDSISVTFDNYKRNLENKGLIEKEIDKEKEKEKEKEKGLIFHLYSSFIQFIHFYFIYLILKLFFF